MRESLFEKLKKKELHFLDELIKIYSLLYEQYTNTYDYFYDAFKISKFNVFANDLDSALSAIFEGETNIYSYVNSFSEKLDKARYSNSNVTLDCFLDYLELFKNLLQYRGRTTQNVIQISNIINFDCDKLGYKFVTDDDVIRVMLKNPTAEAVAIQSNESVRSKIYKYLMIRNGHIKDKRNCIKSLADDVENICKKYNNISEYDKLKQFIQCTRHTKDSPKKEFPFYYNDEEKWLDKTFDMIIGILAFTKTKEIVTEIKKLENTPSEG